MKNILSVFSAGLLLFAYVAPASADSVVQLWTCEINEGKTRAELLAVSAAWLTATQSVDGGADFEAYLEYPMAADDLSTFTFVLIASDAKSWGTYSDAYDGSASEKADEAWEEVADCSSSSLWKSVKIE